MNSLSDRFLTTSVVALVALVFAAAAAAQPRGVNESLAQYGWGAAATYAKQQSHGGKPATLAADDLSQYGWGAAATYAKQQSHGGKPATLAADDLSQYGWGAAATYAKQQAAATAKPSRRTTTGDEPMAMDNGYPTHRAWGPTRVDALYARSEAKANEYYGVGSSVVPVRPDDRATPRPVDTGTIATSDPGDDTAWVDVTVGALGGFGIALLVGIGGFLLISRRRPTTVAH
jgi:hypothetical protein